MDIRRPNPRSGAGLTLIEALATLASVSVTLAIAVPSYQHLALSGRVASAAHSIYSHLNLARSEAVSRAERVIMCPSRDYAGCDPSQDWNHGWILFVDSNRDRERQTDEPLVRVAHQIPEDVRIQTTSGKRVAITYQPDGTVTGDSNTHFRLCVDSVPERNRAVIVNGVGRPRISKRDPNNGRVKCS